MAYFEDGNASVVLDEQCSDCPLGEKQCPVYMAQTLFNFEQISEENTALRQCLLFLVDDAGVCQVKKMIETVCQDLDQRYRFLNQYAFLLKQFNKRVVNC